MTKLSTRFACAFVIAGVIVALGHFAQGQGEPAWVTGSKQALTTYAQGLSQADTNALQACTTNQFWTRIKTPAGKLKAGQLGSFSFLGGRLYNATYAQGLLLRKHPDGVEDVVELTLKPVGGKWKICGGFGPQ